MPYRKSIDYRALVRAKGKRCPVCGFKKAAVEFGKSTKRYDGVQPYCKVCYNLKYGGSKQKYEKTEKARVRKERFKQENPKKNAEYSARYKRTLKRRAAAARCNRAAMDELDRIYSKPASLIGSSLGPRS